jgi:hypothetical protein
MNSLGKPALGERVVEVVGMLPVGDFDRQLARETPARDRFLIIFAPLFPL